MRYCVWCKKPMYTSIESIWVKGENLDIHAPCKKEAEGKCSNCSERKIDHTDYFGTGKKDVCPNRKSMTFALTRNSESGGEINEK